MSFTPVTMVFTVAYPNFPVWAIPMTKVIPRCYIDDSIDINTVTFDLQCQHTWNVVGDVDSFGNLTGTSTVTLQVVLYASAMVGSDIIPTYVDVDLVFINERTYSEINTNKV